MDHTLTWNADEALARLAAGNDRFAGGRGHVPSLQKEILADLAGGQQPCATKFRGAEHGSRIELPVEIILPALEGLDATQPPRALLHSAVEANVRSTLRTLRETPEVKALGATSGMKLVGAIYELETGRVRFLD
ncbi:MAG: hypothetical protein OEX21_09220 [Betaproteobacteria bacterium]|nr:hypothetical protein [Betaproteobacteria bacterium]